MKKFFILSLFIFYFLTPVYAEYQQIPSYQLNQYKVEIESTINTTYPIAKRSIKNISKEVKLEKDNNYRQVTIEQGIAMIIFEFYEKLLKITNKYTPTNIEIPPTDWYGELQKKLEPYLKNAGVNSKKINKLLDYAQREQYRLERKYVYN